MLYNIDMNSAPNWNELFDKQEHCSLCGDTNFMCDCGDLPDYDDMDDSDYE